MTDIYMHLIYVIKGVIRCKIHIYKLFAY